MYKSVDLLKFVFSLCVLCIHAKVLNGTTAYEWVNPLLYRLAVPFFFVASGFFLGKKIYTQQLFNNFNIGGGYLPRLVEKLLIFEPINILLQILIYVFTAKSISYILLKVGRSILFYPWGALWYIQALIVAIGILIPFIKRGKEIYALAAGTLLYGFALICNRYFFVVEGSAFESIVRTYLYLFVTARNGLFEGLFFVSAGLLFSKYWDCIKEKTTLAATALTISYAALCIEVILLQGKQGTDDCSLFIMGMLAIPCLFVVAAQHNPQNIRDTRLLRNLSTSIYLLHAPVLTSINMLYQLRTGQEMNAYILAVSALSLILLFCAFVYRRKWQLVYNWII